VQKFLFPAALGVGRFAKIGIPWPSFSAPFDAVFEIACGALILFGIVTRVSAIPLIIDIGVAIASTKIPLVEAKGFWAAAHEARTDFSMLFGLLFLLIEGGGPWSVDAHWARRRGTNR
jgi:putative oxidoreductase